MLDILFSLQFVWISIVIILLSTALAFLCSFLHKQLLYISSGEWLIEHIYCPVAKLLMLILIAFILTPLIINSISYSDLLMLFIKKHFLINMVNVLFVTSLVLAFLPVLNHPAVAMPVLGCMATALFILHQVALPDGLEIELIPSMSTAIKLLTLMLISYLICRWLTQHFSLWIDFHYNIIGSKALVSDSSHLILQMPVMLAYGHSLKTQLG